MFRAPFIDYADKELRQPHLDIAFQHHLAITEAPPTRGTFLVCKKEELMERGESKTGLYLIRKLRGKSVRSANGKERSTRSVVLLKLKLSVVEGEARNEEL